jgi:aspartate/methionine/tyrosine aminotransferase
MPGDLCGAGGEHHVRLSFAADDGRVRAGLGRLAEFVGQLRPVAAVAPEPVNEPVAVG